MTAELVGKGATGNGAVGQDPHSSHRTVLRHAFNVIVGADAHYVWYRFDPPSSALPLEGITGSGDSGGPLFIGDGSSRQLVGLASWSKYPPGHPFLSKYAQGHPFVEGLYGEIVYGVRISRYIPWIEGVMSTPANAHLRGVTGSLDRTFRPSRLLSAVSGRTTGTHCHSP